MDILKIKEILPNKLKSFCDKNGFEDVVIGLSGGLDSALVLAIACDALGAKHVHTIMMKTKYTTQKSIILAREAAQMNNVEHKELDIQPTVDATLASLDFVPNNEVTEQNIQARVRGMISMAYSNDKKWLLLSCGNKSELAMGYCTLYGDMCGSLSPIGDLYKTQAYELARAYNESGRFFVPEGIINRAPSAELSHGQKDSDSLPEYAVLDNLLQNYVFGDNQAPEDIMQDVQDIKNRYKRNEFKRQQAAPAILIEG